MRLWRAGDLRARIFVGPTSVRAYGSIAITSESLSQGGTDSATRDQPNTPHLRRGATTTCGLKMTQAAAYSVVERLREGRLVTIRALRPQDRRGMLSAAGRVSAQSLYRRFFGPKRGFTEQEVDFFVNVDFVKHVALVAELGESGENAIIGAGRYIVIQPGTAELAFAVIDEYQGQGIGTALLKHLVIIARESGVQQLIAEVLPENAAMLAMFRKSGFVSSMRGGSVHVALDQGKSGHSRE